MFEVTDLRSAGYAMRKVAEIERKEEELKSYANSEKQRIDDWLELESGPLKADKAFFENALTLYYQKLREEDPRAKLSTPYGKVTSRRSKKYNWGDDDKLIAWLKDHEGAGYIRIKTTEAPAKADIKKDFTVADGLLISPQGEVVAGVAVTDEITYNVDAVLGGDTRADSKR